MVVNNVSLFVVWGIKILWKLCVKIFFDILGYCIVGFFKDIYFVYIKFFDVFFV